MIGIFAILALFGIDNKEFFDTVEQNRADGMEWHYVGKQSPDGHPAITVKNETTGEEFIYWKMKIPVDK